MNTTRPLLFRPAGAPAYYLGRPATTWLEALSSNRRRARPFHTR
jgi:hypothetical protein